MGYIDIREKDSVLNWS